MRLVNRLETGTAGRVEPYALVVAMVLPTLVTYLYFVWAAAYPTSIQHLTCWLGKTIQFSLPIVWVRLILGHPSKPEYGSSRSMLLGIAFGLIVAISMLMVYFRILQPQGLLVGAAQGVQRKLAELGCDTPSRFLLLALFYSLVHSFLEEYYWRWFVFGRLGAWVPRTSAIGISSVAFAAHHVVVLARYCGLWSMQTATFTLCVAAGGAFWAWLYSREGSLVPCWFSHLLVDAAIFLIGANLMFANPPGLSTEY
jgi:membrane protease YdiL (CAAX protease family)